MRICIVFLLALISFHGWASDSVRVDLKKSWLMVADGKFVPHSGKGNVAYVELSNLGEGYIVISGSQWFNVFIDNRLVGSHIRQFKMPVRKTLANQKTLAVFSDLGVDNLSLHFLGPASQNPFSSKPNSTSNALILLVILLVATLILLIRTNGQAAIEYFNFIKLFSLRGTEDSALTMRITSANNVFYYLFCSALVAVNLFVLYHGNDLLDFSFGTVMVGVLKLLVLVFSVLTMKIILLSVLASIFKLTDFGPAQFHNYVRLLLVSFMFCSAVLTVLVMVNADYSAWYSRLSYFLAGMSVAFVGITFLKLMARGSFTVFHLFSYLCASEIIPLIILLNVYFS